MPQKTAGMSAQEFTAALARLGLRQGRLADDLGVARSTVSHWATGKAPVAPWVPYLLRLLAERQEIAERLSRAPSVV